MYDDIFVLIPTYNPSLKLYSVIDNLKEAGFNNIVIVDDGSEDKAVFKRLKNYKVLVHDKNMGKGEALKTGFKYITSTNCLGVITVDDDLQQDISDIKKVADKFLESKKVVLGVRTFDKKTPFERKLANKLSSFIFNHKYKTNIKDTQTGLRCFPKEMLNDLCLVFGSRFEYEINVLKYLALNNTHMDYVSIKAIYADEVSHYKSFKDSYRILKAILKKDK